MLWEVLDACLAKAVSETNAKNTAAPRILSFIVRSSVGVGNCRMSGLFFPVKIWANISAAPTGCGDLNNRLPHAAKSGSLHG
jgi:hypothetical protein